MDTKKPDTTTGKLPEPTPILAGESAPTEAESKLVRPRAESASSKAALILAAWQTDCSDLQSQGLKLAILVKENKLYLMVEYPDHVLGFEDGEFLLDGVKVSEA